MTETQLTRGRGTGISPECLEEVLQASKNGGAGQSSFYTPLDFAKLCAIPLPTDRRIITDLQAGSGQLLIGSANETTELGLALDIENCRNKYSEGWPRPDTIRIAGDCTKVYQLLKEVSFEADCFVLNPPWSLHWHKAALAKLAECDFETVRQSFGTCDPTLPAGETIDSTVATLMMALDLMSQRGEGYLIANNDTLERLIFGLDAPFRMLQTHIWARAVLLGNPMTGEIKQTFDKSKDFFTGVIWFARDHADGVNETARCLDMAEFKSAVETIRMKRHRLRGGVAITGKYNYRDECQEIWKAVRKEWEIRTGKTRPDYNIWQAPDGTIQTYLSVFDNKNVKIPKHEAVSLFELNGKMAMELVMMRNERQLLLHHVNGGIWRIHPDLPKQIDSAVNAYYAARAPLYPLNPVQSLGFVDESETLECKIDMGHDHKTRIPSVAEKIVMDCRKLGLHLTYEIEKMRASTWKTLTIGPKKKTPKDLEAATIENKDEIVAFLEREKNLKGFDGRLFCAGKAYKVRTQTVTVSRTVKKPGMDGEPHEHYMKGQELAIWVKDETGVERLFMDRRHAQEGVKVEGDEEREQTSGYKYTVTAELHPDFDLQTIAQHFTIPSAPDVAICQPDRYQAYLRSIDALELLVGTNFKCKPFQRRDLSRAALHDGVVLGWVPGLGKTLAGIFWLLMKVGLHPDANGKLLPAKPILIVAPENLHAQMIQDYIELFGAAMPEVIELDSQETFLKLNPLKPGWYISSFTQIASNKVRSLPEIAEDADTIDDGDLAKLMAFYQVKVQDAVGIHTKKPNGEMESVHNRAAHLCRLQRHRWADGLDKEVNGIKCVYSPSLAHHVRDVFEAVGIDEAVRIKAEDSALGIGVRSLDPKYRLVMTGTPIKNRLGDLFYLAGWACNAMDAANARWPYHCNKEGELARFNNEFMVLARDLTKEREEAEAAGRKWVPPDETPSYKKQRRGKVTAEVCNVHRLWKLLAPVVLRRLKKDIGEDIVSKTKRLIYVPMGSEQAKVTAYHLQARYIDKNGDPAIGAQLQALRNCAAAPHTDLLEDKGNHCKEGVEYLWRSKKDYIPKLHACLTVIEEILRRREQVVVFSAFHEPLDTLSRYLSQAGVPHDVLDGRMNAAARGKKAMEFKLGLPRAKPVLLAGNKAMAEGNSWNLCNNAILYSFDWALDLFLQAIDRVHRLNSKKPVNIYPLVCEGTIDRKLESMIDEKDDSTELVLDGNLMTETIEEVNLAALLKIAHSEFSADKAISEDECIAGWPDLCAKLTEANNLLLTGITEQVKQQAAATAVMDAIRKPAEVVLTASNIPLFTRGSPFAFR